MSHQQRQQHRRRRRQRVVVPLEENKPIGLELDFSEEVSRAQSTRAQRDKRSAVLKSERSSTARKLRCIRLERLRIIVLR